MSFISRIYKSPEVQQEVEKAVKEQRDPMRSMGERVVGAVKGVLGLNPPQKQEYTGYVKS
jgi:hypothetical protein